MGEGLYRPYPLTSAFTEEGATLLAYAHKWYLECRYGGCSCHFRHAQDPREPHFAGPSSDEDEDEDEDVIESTAAFYDLVTRIVGEGHRLDIVDVWSDTPSERVKNLEVSLAQTPRETFRFIQSYRMNVVA